MPIRGNLQSSDTAPDTGEHTTELLRLRNLMIEQILSGTTEPHDYRQNQDEWVLVLSGHATLDVAGETLELTTNDWLLLPAGTPHTLLHTEPGTNWLAIHLFPEPAPER